MTVAEFDKNITIYRDQLYKYILTKCKYNEALAEDIVQITFIKAFKYLSKNKIRNETFKSWIYTIAVNSLITHYRNKENNRFLYDDILKLNDNDDPLDYFDELKYNDFEKSIVDKLILQDIMSCGFEELKNIKPETYEILIDAIEGKDYSSIAEDRNIPENTVKTRIFRARKFLQKYLEKKDLSFN